MKKEYITPQCSVIALHNAALLQMSGGSEGGKDDWAETKRFWGNSVWEQEEDETGPEDIFN